MNYQNQKLIKKTKTMDKQIRYEKKISEPIKKSTFKFEEKNKEKNGQKLFTIKEKTLTSKIKQKSLPKIKEDDEIKKRNNKKLYTAGKSADSRRKIKSTDKKKADNKRKIKSTDKKKLKTKKKESESSSSSSESDSDSDSYSESRSSKESKSKNKSKSNSNSSINRTFSSPSISDSGTDSDEEKEKEKENEKEKNNEKEKEIKNNENQSNIIRSNTNVAKSNINLDNTNKQNQKNENKDEDKEKDKEKQKQENNQILNNVPKINPPTANETKTNPIVNSRYLRRRSMDNPLTRQRLELLVNQMTLKQNGGDTKFLRNYESGPSYQKEITLITKDKQPVKKTMKIDVCTKAGCSGPGIVKTNQDAYFIKENFLKNKEYYYIGVCDGHGEHGHLVSNYVINKLPSYIKDLSNESIIEAFKKANKEIYSSSKMDSKMSGTTVVSIIITPNNIICVNLGDSRASLFRYENGLYYCRNLSRDHKPSEPDESKRIVNNGGRVKKCYDEEHKRYIGPDRVWVKNKEEPGLAMTRSLGDKIAHSIGVTDEPEFKTFSYDGTEKYIIIASDGLWEYVNGDQCINIVKPFYEEGKDSKEAALALVKEAFRKWKRKEVAIDDITVIVIFFD